MSLRAGGRHQAVATRLPLLGAKTKLPGPAAGVWLSHVCGVEAREQLTILLKGNVW